MSVIDAIIAKKLCGGGGGGSVPKPLTYDYMPEGYPKKSVGIVTVMEEQEVAFALNEGIYGARLTEAFEIVGGQTYKVSWDGTEYECVCFAFNSGYALGNPSIFGGGDDTGEPFLYMSGAFGTLDTSASHTISVKTTAETVTPMTYDYMPDGYPKKSVQTTTLMEEQELAFVFDSNTGLSGGTLPTGIEIDVGQTYGVNWDGTEYKCVGKPAFTAHTSALGNLSLANLGADTGEPFFYVYDNTKTSGTFATVDTATAHTINIKKIEETVIPMAEEFLPAVALITYDSNTSTYSSEFSNDELYERLLGGKQIVLNKTVDNEYLYLTKWAKVSSGRIDLAFAGDAYSVSLNTDGTIGKKLLS